MRCIFIIILIFLFVIESGSQNYDFNYSTTGRRVCLVESETDPEVPSVTINLLDHTYNTSDMIYIYRRSLNSQVWTPVASGLPASAQSWTDTDVSYGDIWEYQVKRRNTWTYNGSTYDAIGYTIGSVEADQSGYQGQMILLVADDVVNSLPEKFNRLKKELTGEGWYVNVLTVDRANNWNSGDDVVEIRSQIQDLYNNVPANDKPKVLFILGHVPFPRSGLDEIAPDGHYWHQGARGCDAYYADVDGVYTDVNSYSSSSLLNTLQNNSTGDYKWDQDYFPSDIEMAFGRVDFADLLDVSGSEMSLIENYLDRLSNYKNVAQGYKMGKKTAFYYGSYQSSNDGSYRSLFNISGAENVIQNRSGGTHPQWVHNNGPFQVYMQNEFVPEITEWNTYGMDATVYTSDQSSWGYNDLPQEQGYLMSRIRALIATDTKCLVALWTTSAINLFYQAGTGQPLGLSMKEIMNHNSVNQKLEKPKQDFDRDEWWNRTHFAFNGDPTLRLYQVAPPVNLNIEKENDSLVLKWDESSETELLGYNIYESDNEFGIYTKINSAIVTESKYIPDNYNEDNWYMVRAVKIEETGCGSFINPSMGICASLTDSLSCQPSYSTLSIQECNSYELNGHMYSTSGTYYQNLTSYNGCDSIITLNLTITSVDNSVTNNSNVLTATETGATYQWLSCENNSLISNETNRSFEPLVSGEYAVKITLNGCTDTSDCLPVTVPDNPVCQSTYSEINAQECNSYELNGYEYSSGGTYYQNLINHNGCDSVITIHLTIISVNQSVLDNNNVLTSMESGASYQWIDCINQLSIYNETGQSFEPVISGEYAVIVNKNGCIDTSSCTTVLISEEPGCQNTFKNITAEACNYYILNGQKYINSGVFYQHLTSSEGCDSTIALFLTIHKINNDIIQIGNVLLVDETNAAYQWINCNTMTPVPGATQVRFIPEENGNYALVMNKYGCIDTSTCYLFYSEETIKLNNEDTKTMVFPNPASNRFFIFADAKSDIKIFNTDGILVYEQFNVIGLSEVNVIDKKGIFIIYIINNNSVHTHKLIIQ